MEQNKLENQIKAELANREIQPSHEAFEKLDFMLSKNEVKRKATFPWVHIAASIMVFFTISILFWKNEPAQNIKRAVVEVIHKESKKPSIEEYYKPEKVLAPMNEKKSVVSKEKQTVIKSELELIAQNKDSEPLPPKLIANKIDVNPESISAIAEKPISSTIKSKITVDPNFLLSKVDGELELSFRDKVLTKINKNYQEVKVVLVTRNQQ